MHIVPLCDPHPSSALLRDTGRVVGDTETRTHGSFVTSSTDFRPCARQQMWKCNAHRTLVDLFTTVIYRLWPAANTIWSILIGEIKFLTMCISDFTGAVPCSKGLKILTKFVSSAKKHRKNCECCPGHSLTVNHYSSMSWFKFRNFSVIVNCVTKSLNH